METQTKVLGTVAAVLGVVSGWMVGFIFWEKGTPEAHALQQESRYDGRNAVNNYRDTYTPEYTQEYNSLYTSDHAPVYNTVDHTQPVHQPDVNRRLDDLILLIEEDRRLRQQQELDLDIRLQQAQQQVQVQQQEQDQEDEEEREVIVHGLG